MTQIDQFESVFRSAAKEVFSFHALSFSKALLVTDLAEAEAQTLIGHASLVTKGLEAHKRLQWQHLSVDSVASTQELLAQVDAAAPDLICTYRNLGSSTWQFPHSLGEHLDVLTQCTKVPVLVLPHPKLGYDYQQAAANGQRVMAVTDHLSGDGRLINHAVHFSEKNGTLYLAHVEDDHQFERVMDAISKIPTIDTEDARKRLSEKLLAGPRDYIGSAKTALASAGVDINIEMHVSFGHHLKDYQSLIEEHKVDLLVMNTKDDDQLAMHGLAYPLAVELRELPLLML